MMIRFASLVLLSLLTTSQFANPKGDDRGLLPALNTEKSTEKESDSQALKSEVLISKTENNAIEALQSILKKKKGSPQEPDLLTRLAELYMRKSKSGRFFDLQRSANSKTLSSFPVAQDKGADVLVGSGAGQVISIEEKLREEAGTAPLEGRVTFTGRVDNVAAFLQASDVFAFPTLDEALGMSAVEAQACGLAAVASRTGGVPDVIEDGVTGILARPGDAGALALGLRTLAADAQLRDRYAKAARRRMQERFAIDTMISRYAELFRSRNRRSMTA